MPQLDSYITDVLMRDLVGHDRRPVSFLVYLWWLTAEQESRKREVQISYQELAEKHRRIEEFRTIGSRVAGAAEAACRA